MKWGRGLYGSAPFVKINTSIIYIIVAFFESKGKKEVSA